MLLLVQVGQRLVVADEELRRLVGEHGAAAEVRERLERKLADLIDQINASRRQQGALPVVHCCLLSAESIKNILASKMGGTDRQPNPSNRKAIRQTR